MVTSAYPIRPIAEAEFDGFWEVLDYAFNLAGPQSERDEARRLIEFDRTLAAVDGDRFVGTTAAFSLTMTVPGGPRQVAGITAVGVLPTHRRRGVLTGLMHRQLTDLHEGGEAVAALYASETPIYPRYGYGCASRLLDVTVRRGETAFVPGAPDDPGLRLRLAAPGEVRERLAAVYEAQNAGRPGFLPRTEAWWDQVLHDPEHRREGYGPLRCAIAEDDTGPRGYALFSTKPAWNDAQLPDGRVDVRELFATDPAAYAAVWRHVLDRDLVTTITAAGRPLDDPITQLLADTRRLRPRVRDGLWVRLVDVGTALAQRSYAAPVDVVIEVGDPGCPWNERRWRLTADGAEVACEPTGGSADVALPVTSLGAAYLGAPVFSAQAGAGLVTELRPGALAELTRALAWDPLPWCPMEF